MEENNKCDICNSKKFIELCVNDGARLVECVRCGHIFINPLPEKKLLDKLYSNEIYFQEKPEDEENIKFLWKRRYKSIKNELSKEKGNLLDVGCGKGFFLEEAKEDGWSIFGTEYSNHTAKYALDNYGINVFVGDLLHAKYGNNLFKVISFWHVLEHLFSPSVYIKEANRIMERGGLLVVESPNVGVLNVPYAKQIVENKTHIHFFSEKDIINLLSNNGFRIIKLTYEDPRHYKKKWLSIIHHKLEEAIVKMIRIVFLRNIGSTIRILAVKK